MVIAAKTGQGKTLCFGLPILDLLVKKCKKFNDNQSSSESDEDA
jgi:superfamily II DNA/RNA helicase